MTDRTDSKGTAYSSATAASKASTAGIDGGQKSSSNNPSQGLKMPTKADIEATSKEMWADGTEVPYRKEDRQNLFEKS